jgi:hypothetical protein
MNPGGRLNRFFVIILLAYSFYVAAFIYRTSFVIDGTCYYCLFDDAMISMRYAHNFAAGQGLVWNPGETPVEGYTNPLWVMYMAVLHLFPLHPSKISLCIQISGAIFLFINLFFVRKIASYLSGGSILAVMASVVLTASFLSLNNWGLQGMEVSLLALLISMAVWKAFKFLDSGGSPLGLFLLLGLATWVRLDMVVVYLALWGYLLLVRRDRKLLFTGAALLLFFIGSQTLFRLWYYGDPLPNTYYLKMTGFPLGLRLERGLYVAGKFMQHLWFVFFLAPVAVLVPRRNKRFLLLASVFLGQMAYSVWVGGDAWEYWGLANRYITVAMPLFFILLGISLAQGEGWISNQLKSPGGLTPKVIRGLMVLIILLVMIAANTVYSPNASLREWLLLRSPLAVQQNREMVERALVLKEVTYPQARLAVVWAGAIPYFADRAGVDLLGKNDWVIAHEPAHHPSDKPDYLAFYPGHMKWDYHYSISQLKPDVVVQFYGLAYEETGAYIIPDYHTGQLEGRTTHFLIKSDKINWYGVYQHCKQFGP